MKEEGQRGCSRRIMKREVLKLKHFFLWGGIKSGGDDLRQCNCFIFGHHLSSSETGRGRIPLSDAYCSSFFI